MTKFHNVVPATTEVELSQRDGEDVHHDGCRTLVGHLAPASQKVVRVLSSE
jgi:hypothetical protein